MSTNAYAYGFGCHRRHRSAPVRLLAASAGGRGHRRRGSPLGRGGSGLGPFLFGGPGGFRRGPRARRGDVRAAVLLLLAEGPRNGYQLMQEIEERSSGVWRPSAGSIYPVLSQLADEGLVTVEAEDGRRTYVLTDAGRAQVEDRAAELGAPWEEMSGAVDDEIADLFGEIRQVAAATAQIGRIGDSRQVAQARRLLVEVRRALYRLLAEDEPEQPGDE